MRIPLAKYLRPFKKYFILIKKAGFNPNNFLKLASTDKVETHPLLRKILINDFSISEIEQEIDLPIYNKKNGQNEGFHKFTNAWWYNLNCEYSFNYFNIDSFYPEIYFETERTGHPDPKYASELYEYMQKIYLGLFNNHFTSILELGTGGGEITSQFNKNKLDYIAVEGTKMGYKKLIEIGIPDSRILNIDLRKMKSLDRKFDIVMCTEVAEHIEPFFASKIIDLCISHSDVIWFSSSNRKRRPHYHHINEVSEEAWDNLFAFMGYNYYLCLNRLHARADRLYFSENIIKKLLHE